MSAPGGSGDCKDSGGKGANGESGRVANFSVLAEYEKNLLEEFEIFALDGAGGSGSFQIQKSEGRLRYYLKANTDPLSGEGGFGLFDPWRLMLTDLVRSRAMHTDRRAGRAILSAGSRLYESNSAAFSR